MSARRLRGEWRPGDPLPVDEPKWFVRVIGPNPVAPPLPRPKSSRVQQREREKAEQAARDAAAAAALSKSVVRGMRPPAGRLSAVDAAALLLVGPGGAIPITGAQAVALAPYAAGGRHPETPQLSEAAKGLALRLAAVGLRIDRRKAGVRLAKEKAVRQ